MQNLKNQQKFRIYSEYLNKWFHVCDPSFETNIEKPEIRVAVLFVFRTNSRSLSDNPKFVSVGFIQCRLRCIFRSCKNRPFNYPSEIEAARIAQTSLSCFVEHLQDIFLQIGKKNCKWCQQLSRNSCSVIVFRRKPMTLQADVRNYLRYFRDTVSITVTVTTITCTRVQDSDVNNLRLSTPACVIEYKVSCNPRLLHTRLRNRKTTRLQPEKFNSGRHSIESFYFCETIIAPVRSWKLRTLQLKFLPSGGSFASSLAASALSEEGL